MISILLLAVFGLAFVAPLLALQAASGAALPACCRRGGEHHCAMAGLGSSPGETMLRAPVARCPYAPRMVVSAHADPVVAARGCECSLAPDSRATSVAQTEGKWRLAQERSRQKRGPPGRCRFA